MHSPRLAPVVVLVLSVGCGSTGDTEMPSAADAELRFWLESMAWHHEFTMDEMAKALGVAAATVPALLQKHGIDPEKKPPATAGETVKVLPYPGGRHPRIGFLDGAIDPHRDTKFSVFLPWEKSGHIVVDFPEALWCQHGLAYLAHTHIPTMWDKAGVTLERQDWTRKTGGVLESTRVLPNGLGFTARVLPRKDAVDMELQLKNGSTETLTKLRTQICVLLRDAVQMNGLTNDNKKIIGKTVGVKSQEGSRWVLTSWDLARPWNNKRCPCMHSDPTFPDLAPGEEHTLRGRIAFYQGDDLEGEIARRKKAGTLNWTR